jgi:hypothetical protein
MLHVQYNLQYAHKTYWFTFLFIFYTVPTLTLFIIAPGPHYTSYIWYTACKHTFQGPTWTRCGSHLASPWFRCRTVLVPIRCCFGFLAFPFGFLRGVSVPPDGRAIWAAVLVLSGFLGATSIWVSRCYLLSTYVVYPWFQCNLVAWYVAFDCFLSGFWLVVRRQCFVIDFTCCNNLHNKNLARFGFSDGSHGSVPRFTRFWMRFGSK